MFLPPTNRIQFKYVNEYNLPQYQLCFSLSSIWLPQHYPAFENILKLSTQIIKNYTIIIENRKKNRKSNNRKIEKRPTKHWHLANFVNT